MDALLLIARVALMLVFAVAAAGKLADRAGTREAVRSFGAPGYAAGPVALILPLLELAVAALLLVPATAVAGAIGALCLLTAFSIAIAVNLARGETPDCHCFGQLHSEPIGTPTLIRNGLLATAALVVAIIGWDDPGPSAINWIAPGSLALGMGLGIAAAGWIAFTLTRRYGRALRRIDQLEMALLEGGLGVPEPEDPPKLPIGSPAPALPGMRELLAGGKPLLVSFTSPGCGPCQELKARLAEWRVDHAEMLEFVELDYEANEKLADAYGVGGTPAAIVVGADRQVESAVAHGVVDIGELLEETVLAHLPAPADVGEPVPDLHLRTLAGDRVSLHSALATDSDTLLLFWNPGCGFCSAMREDLDALDEGLLDGHPSLLVVSTGHPDDVREARFHSQVLLDPISLTSATVGAGGTPTAILVGPDATVRSAIVGGRDAVLGLAGVGGEGDDGLQVVMAGAARDANGTEG